MAAMSAEYWPVCVLIQLHHPIRYQFQQIISSNAAVYLLLIRDKQLSAVLPPSLHFGSNRPALSRFHVAAPRCVIMYQTSFISELSHT